MASAAHASRPGTQPTSSATAPSHSKSYRDPPLSIATDMLPSRYHIGGWGNPYEGGGQPGKGVTTYAMSANRQNPFAGFLSKGLFNTFRRSRNQFLYVVPPFVAAYFAMDWAQKRYVDMCRPRKRHGG
jgi:hypothetical protein